MLFHGIVGSQLKAAAKRKTKLDAGRKQYGGNRIFIIVCKIKIQREAIHSNHVVS